MNIPTTPTPSRATRSPCVKPIWYSKACISCGVCKNERTEKTAELCPVNVIWKYGKEYSVAELLDVICMDKPFFQNGGGVTLSGGECLFQPEFAIALAKALHEQGISVYIDTCGFVERKIFERILPYVDKFMYDIKAIDQELHIKCTGRSNRMILENLAYLCECGAKVEIRYPLVKGYNDGECERIACLLIGLKGITKIKVLQYHSFSVSRYEALGMKNTMPSVKTTEENVEKAVHVLKSYGLNAVHE